MAAVGFLVTGLYNRSWACSANVKAWPETPLRFLCRRRHFPGTRGSPAVSLPSSVNVIAPYQINLGLFFQWQSAVRCEIPALCHVAALLQGTGSGGVCRGRAAMCGAGWVWCWENAEVTSLQSEIRFGNLLWLCGPFNYWKIQTQNLSLLNSEAVKRFRKGEKYRFLLFCVSY